MPAPGTPNTVLEVGSAAQNSHAKTATSSPLRRKNQRNAVAKASKHSPLLKDLKIRSMMKNFNLNSPSSSAASTGVFGWPELDLFSGSTSIPAMLHPPQPYSSIERILHLVRQYTNGFFDAGTWPLHSLHSAGVAISGGRYGIVERSLSAMNNFYLLHTAAHRMMKSPSSESLLGACELISEAYDNFRPMIEGQHHNTLVQLFSVIVLFDSPGPASELRLKGLQFFGGMAATMLGDDHPITGIVAALSTIDESAITDTIAQAWEVLAVCFERNLSFTHHVTVNCRLRMIESIFVKPSTLQKAEGLLRRLLNTTTAAECFNGIQSASIEYSLAKLFLHQSEPAKCIELAYSVIDTCQNARKEDESAAAALESSTLQVVATAQYQMGQHVAADSCLRECVQIRISKWGMQSPIALDAMVSLEQFLTAIQKHEEASKIMLQRLSITSQLKGPS
jgi:hypothetical protein